MIDTSVIESEIVNDLTTELESEEGFNANILANKVKLAVREVMSKRNYGATSWNDENILADLYNYYSVIENVARYDYNQIGVEGESSHSENGIARVYIDRDTLFKGVHAFVGIF